MPPELAKAVTLEVKEVATSTKIDQRWGTIYGSYDREFYRTKKLNVSLSNVSRLPAGGCQLRVYWLSKNLSDSSIHVHHSSQEPVTIGAGARS